MEDGNQNGCHHHHTHKETQVTGEETEGNSEVKWSPLVVHKDILAVPAKEDSDDSSSSYDEPDVIIGTPETREEVLLPYDNDKDDMTQIRTQSMAEPDAVDMEDESDDDWDPESITSDEEEEELPIAVMIEYTTLEQFFHLIGQSTTKESDILEKLTSNSDIAFILNKSYCTPLVSRLIEDMLLRQWMKVTDLIFSSDLDNVNELILLTHRELELALLSNDELLASSCVNKLTARHLLTLMPINIQLNSGNTLLHLSVIFNNETLFCDLLANNASTIILNHTNDTPLHLACSLFSMPSIEKALEATKDKHCNKQNIVGETPFHCLLKAKNWDGLAYDILSKFNLKLQDNDGNTVLHLACKVDSELVVKLLAADPRTPSCMLIRNYSNETFLDLLVKKCFEKPQGSYNGCFEVLLQKPKSFSWLPQEDDLKTIKSMMLIPQSQTELFLISLVKHPKINECLFEKEHNNTTPSIFETLVQSCIQNPSPPLCYMLETFFEHPRSNYWFINNRGIARILLNALLDEKMSLFNTFLAHPMCDLTVPLTKSQDTLLHIVCSRKSFKIEALFSLLSHPQADPNLTNIHKDTPIHVACRHGNFELVSFIGICKTLNLSLINLKGNTPLMELLQRLNNHGNVDTLDELSEVFPEIHLGDNMLHVATRMNYALQFSIDIITPKEESILTKSYNSLNKEGHSPLYIALETLQFEKAEVLLSAYNPHGYSLLQHACLSSELFESVSHLLKVPKYHQTLKQIDRKGNTPLHIATMSQNTSQIVKLIIDLDPSQGLVRNCSGETPLHIACQYQYTELIDVLLKACPKAVSIKDDDDYLPLHSACQIGDAETVKALLDVDPDPVTSLTVRNGDGNIPIHLICKENASLLHYVLSNYKLDKVFTIVDSQGNTPFHLILKLRSNEEIIYALKAIFKQVQEVPLIYNKCGYTVYHECIQETFDDPLKVILENKSNKLTCENIAELVGYAVQLEPSSISKIDILLDHHTKEHPCGLKCHALSSPHDEYSLLHYAAKVDCVLLASKLIEVFKVDPSCVGLHGNTPLHMACIYNSQNVARFLLSTTECDINVCNANNLSPLEIVKNSLPMLELFDKFQNLSNCRNQYAIDSYCKVFVTGDSGAGKTTVIEVFKNFVKSKGAAKLFGKLSKQTQVEKQTAGIIPSIFSGEGVGNLIIYDLAGHFEYHSSHSAVLEHLISSSCPLFVLLINFAVSLKEVQGQLYYWLNLLQSHSSKLTSVSPVIVIGSHDDEASKKPQYLEKKTAVSRIFSQNYSSLRMVNFIQMDCRVKSSSGLETLQRIAVSECSQLREMAPKVSVICHGLYAFLTTAVSKDEVHVAVQLGDLKKNLEESEHDFLPKDCTTLSTHLTTLSDKGLIMFLRNSKELSKSWIIVQQDVLLSQINGHLFAPKNFNTHIETVSNTGLVPKSYFTDSFSQYVPVDTLVEFLVHFELCQELDLTLFPNIEFFEDDEELPIEKLLFFPALIQEDYTDGHLWPPDNTSSSTYYWFNWVLQCTSNIPQFFTKRFLHVLLLRLAFGFALPLSNIRTPLLPSSVQPGIKRRCSIWKTGIRWLKNGIWTMVHLTNNHQTLNVVMAAPRDNHINSAGCISTVAYRTQIMYTILNTKNQFCKDLVLYEVFRDPSRAYLPFDESFKLPPISESRKYYSLSDIQSAVLQDQTPGTSCHITDSSGSQDITLSELLLFDIYQGFSLDVLDDLFKISNENEMVLDTFVPKLVASLKCTRHFMNRSPSELGMTIFSLPESQVNESIEPTHSEYHQCCAVVRLWIEETPKSTYKELHKCFDKLSVFAGRNPKVSDS